jgi:hypothetical protein
MTPATGQAAARTFRYSTQLFLLLPRLPLATAVPSLLEPFNSPSTPRWTAMIEAQFYVRNKGYFLKVWLICLD